MAKLLWVEWNPSDGKKSWLAAGPYRNIAANWEIRLESELLTGDQLYKVYADTELGGYGREPDSLEVDYFLSLGEAMAFCQQMHDEAICGSSD